MSERYLTSDAKGSNMIQNCKVCGESKEIHAKQMCKKCYHKAHYEANKERLQIYRDTHREEINTRSKLYRGANREHLNDKSKKYNEANKEARAVYHATYHVSHKEKRNAMSKEHYRTNKNTYSIKGAAYRESNKDKCKAQFAAWYKANREYVLARQAGQRRLAGVPLRSGMCGENSPTWRGGVSFGKYCEKWTKKLRSIVREKYDHCDYLSGIHMDICNAGKALDVHHVDYDKGQGCNGKQWALVPLSMRNHSRTNFNRPFWNTLFIYALAYEDEYTRLTDQVEEMRRLI